MKKQILTLAAVIFTALNSFSQCYCDVLKDGLKEMHESKGYELTTFQKSRIDDYYIKQSTSDTTMIAYDLKGNFQGYWYSWKEQTLSPEEMFKFMGGVNMPGTKYYILTCKTGKLALSYDSKDKRIYAVITY